MRKINLLSLKYFCAIAQQGNMTRAAEMLHVSQPALSKMLHQLELEVGQSLFYRLPSGLQLTEGGQSFYEKISAALELIHSGVVELQRGGAHQQTLRIFSCINASFLAQLYLNFQKLYPLIRLELKRGAWNTLPQEGAFDFAFTSSTSPIGSYQFTDLFEEEFVLVCPLEHPLYKEDSIDLAQAAPYSFVTLGDSASVTQYFKALCSVAQFAPKIAVECDTISTLYAFLESGQAIAFMPSHSARLNPDKLHSVRIRSPHCSRTIRLCWPAGRELTPPEMLFYSFCKDYFSAFHSHPESP